MILIVADSMMRIGIEVQDAVYSVGCMGVADGGSRVPSIAWHPGEHWCPHGYVYLIPSDHVPSGDKGGPAGLFRVSLRWSIPWASVSHARRRLIRSRKRQKLATTSAVIKAIGLSECKSRPAVRIV